MSASLMDSVGNKFAGVINVQNIQNPIVVAHRLMRQHHSVLAGEKATFFAHEVLGEEVYNPVTNERWKEYLQQKLGLTGTVGAVVLDNNNNICAATSTGGVGYEVAGRVGDSPTVAGNFASSEVGVSCTGIGEHIVNAGTAVKINTRVKDGMDLSSAVEKTIAESDDLGDYVGLIAIDSSGTIISKSTSSAQALYAFHDGQVSETFYDSLKS
jgi:L-asparaginase